MYMLMAHLIGHLKVSRDINDQVRILHTWATLSLAHCQLVMPYGDTDVDQHWLQQWLVAWRYRAITWTIVDSLVRLCAIQMRAIPQWVPKLFIILYSVFENNTFKITATSHRGPMS